MDVLMVPISPWLYLWEAWTGEWLPRGQYSKCDTSPLLRTDILSRFRAYHMMVGSRAFTQDEVREMEDFPPLTAEQQAQIDRMPMQPLVPGPRSGE